MSNFVFPTSRELQEIAQDKIPRLMTNRPIFDIMPIRSVEAHLVSFEQMDNYTGLQQLRGLNGQPSRVNRTGLKRYDFQPGTYGEFMEIDERELTTRRQIGTFGTPISIADLTMSAQDHLLGRRLDRIEKIGWDLLVTGTFSVAMPYGSGAHTDTYTIQSYASGTSGVSTSSAGLYDIQKFTTAIAWSTHATSTPLADLRAMKLLQRGHSVSFGHDSILYVNQGTMNDLLANTNATDLGGKRTSGLATVLSPDDLNRVLMSEDLPSIQVYDEGYLAESNGAFTLFIPDGTGVLVGKRPAGQKICEYQMTRNVNNPDMSPGAYMKIIDRGETQVPRSIEVHDGHNGGPAIMFPGSIAVFSYTQIGS